MSLSVIGFLLFFGLRGTDDPDVERAVAPTEEAAAALSEPPPELEREAPAGLPPDLAASGVGQTSDLGGVRDE